MKARPIEIDTVTKRMKYSGSTEGRENDSSLVGTQMKTYITQSEETIYKSKMSVYYFSMIIMFAKFLDASLVVYELTTGPLSNPFHFLN